MKILLTLALSLTLILAASLRNTRKTGTLPSAPPNVSESSFLFGGAQPSPLDFLKNTRKTGSVPSAPPNVSGSSFLFGGAQPSPLDFLKNTRKTGSLSSAPPNVSGSSFLFGGAQPSPLRFKRSGPATNGDLLEGFRLVEVASVADAMEQLYGAKAYMYHDMRPLAAAKFAGPAVTVALKKEENQEGAKALAGHAG